MAIVFWGLGFRAFRCRRGFRVQVAILAILELGVQA